jgi:SAM-dependent methyltransferase
MQKFIRKSKIWSGKIIRMLLRTAFRFEQWHTFTLTEREYAKDIIVYCNQKNVKNVFAEIGCGLGDIIKHAKYRERYGYDVDANVLKAAIFLDRFTLKKKIRFSVFNFPVSTLPGSYDVIVMVNWIHLIEPAILKSKISEYFNNSLKEEGFIIIDTVQDQEYKFNHDIQYLSVELGARVSKLGDYERQREIWVLKK